MISLQLLFLCSLHESLLFSIYNRVLLFVQSYWYLLDIYYIYIFIKIYLFMYCDKLRRSVAQAVSDWFTIDRKHAESCCIIYAILRLRKLLDRMRVRFLSGNLRLYLHLRSYKHGISSRLLLSTSLPRVCNTSTCIHPFVRRPYILTVKFQSNEQC